MHNMEKERMKFINNKKGMKPVTLVLILLIAFVALGGTSWLAIDSLDFKTGMVYVGRVKVNNIEVKRLDGSAYDVTDSMYRVIHGSGDWNDKVGTYSSDSITGDLNEADNGKWVLCIDYGTNTTNWLDHAETLKDPYITRIYGQDGDRDGFDETYCQLSLGNLPPLKAGESQKEIEITTVWCVSDLNPAYTSLTNASSIGTSSYSYYTATGYTTGTAEGELMKLAKIEIDFSQSNATESAANASYPDSEYWKLTHLKLGPYTFTPSQFGNYDLANKRYQLTFGDQINHIGGKDIYFPKNGGTLWCPYELKAYCNYPSSSQNIYVTVKIFLYQPNGVITSAINAETAFSS